MPLPPMLDREVLQALAEYRLQRNLSFDALAAEMNALGFVVRARLLHLALTDRVKTQPYARTMFKLRGFVETLSRPKARLRRRRRAA